MTKYLTVDEVRLQLSPEETAHLRGAEAALTRLLYEHRAQMRPQMAASIANATGVLALYGNEEDQ